MNGKMVIGAAVLLTLGACSARDEGNGSSVISVDRNAVNAGLGDAGNALKDAGNEVKGAADKAAPVITNAADKAGDAVSNAADRTGAAAKRAGDKADNAVDNTNVTVTTNTTEHKR
jgi:uncharacterized protein YjbJ (UPF0337 family)